MESVTHAFTNYYNYSSLNVKFVSIKHIILYILEQPNVDSTATNEPVLAPLSKQTESFHSPREIGLPTTSH
jgi:hypothetical protein